MSKLEYLYEVSKNGINFEKVKVAKECAKTFYLDRICDKRVYKTTTSEELAGYNTYCWFFTNEVIAKKWLDRIRNRDFMPKVEIKKISTENQKAIECLEDVKKYACLHICFTSLKAQNDFYDFIDQKISELKGE